MESKVAGILAPPPPRRAPARPPADPGDRLFLDLARRLRRRSGSIYAVAIGSLHAKGGAASEAARGRVEESVRRVLAAQLSLLGSAAPAGRLAASELIPGPVLVEAGEFELLLFALRAVHISLWEAWFALVEEEEGLAAPQRRALLARGSEAFFSYAGLLSARAIAIFRRETEALRLGPDGREARAFHALLAGDRLAAASLRFDFARHHLGLIAWGAEDPVSPAAGLARALARPLFTVRPPERVDECWAWISGTRPLTARERRLIASWLPDRGRLAVGLEGFGEAGFCAGHHQAARARRFVAAGSQVVRYEEVIVEALVTENEADARAFLGHELRGIDDDSPASVRLRETLLAWFRSGQNAASAAAALGVHQQTVANRLRVAEERLGHASIGARRVELELALRLHRRLGVAPAEDGDSAPPPF